MMCDHNLAVVVDNGTDRCIAGFAGDYTPRIICPTVVGRVKNKTDSLAFWGQGVFVGNKTKGKRGYLKVSCPIQRDIVTNWDDMETLLHHIYSDLKVDSTERPVLLTENPFNDKKSREKMTQVMFEQFRTPAMYMALQPVLSLYSHARTTGVVVHSGHGTTHIVPIYEGYAIRHAISSLDFGGSDLSEYLKHLLHEKKYYLGTQTAAELETLRDIKESMCYVALDFDQETSVSDFTEKSYVLPDGQEIGIGKERFRCPEALFQPSLLEKDGCGIHEAMYHSIMKTDKDIHMDLCANTVLSGGSTTFLGIADRLKKEITSIDPSTKQINIIDALEFTSRKLSVWKGGSIMASLSSFQENYISVKEYAESGTYIIHKKCF